MTNQQTVNLKSDNHKKAVEKWEWLSENPGKGYGDYKSVFYKKQYRSPYNLSPEGACDEANKRADEKGAGDESFTICKYCPVNWGDGTQDNGNKLTCAAAGINKWKKLTALYKKTGNVRLLPKTKVIAQEMLRLVKYSWE